MKPNARKQNLNEPKASKLTFLDLNDDSILGILQELSKEDLCSMSFTCKRLQQLVFYHYSHQYPDEQTTITTYDSVYFYSDNLLEETFRKCIRNVRIESLDTHENLQRLLDYVDTKCCADLRTLELDIHGLLKEVHVQSIKSRLQNLSKLTINAPHDLLDIHNALLKYCENLEHLCMRLSSHFDVFWMMHKYPTIKTLSIGLMSRESTKLFDTFAEKFFQLNPQIKSFDCLGIECGTEWNKFIRTILVNVTDIQRLALIPVHFITNWIPIINQLIHYTKQNQVKWLHLKIGFQTKNNNENKLCTALAELNAVQPISEFHYILTDLPCELKLIGQLKSVKQLTFGLSWSYKIGEELVDVLSTKLPNLQQLELSVREQIGFVFKWVAIKFVQNSLKLRSLTFTYCLPDTFIFNPDDLVTLNECRSSLSCASHLVIECQFIGNFEKPVFKHPQVQSAVRVKFTKMDFKYREVRY